MNSKYQKTKTLWVFLFVSFVLVLVGGIIYQALFRRLHKESVTESVFVERVEQNNNSTAPLIPHPLFPDSIYRLQRMDSIRHLMKGVPIGGQRDSLIAKLFDLNLDWCPNGVAHCDLHHYGYAHQTNGRIDTLIVYFKGQIPPEISDLSELKHLVIDGDSTALFPMEMGNLHNLIHLELHSQVKLIPPFIYNLESLQSLDMSNNRITKIDPDIKNLTHLVKLDLQENQINFLPVEIKYLSHLAILKIGKNPLKSLPVEIVDLTRLDTLEITPNILHEDNIDTTVVAWLNKNSRYWSIQPGQRELRTLVQDLGAAYLPKTPLLKFRVRRNKEGEMDTLNTVQISPKNLNTILAKVDSQNLVATLRKITEHDSGPFTPKKMIRGLLSAYDVCEKFPYLFTIFITEVTENSNGCCERPYHWDEGRGSLEWVNYERWNEERDALLKIWEINQPLGDYIRANRFYFLFWGERHRDKSMTAMVDVLRQIRKYCYPSISLDTLSLFNSAAQTVINPVYFNSNFFSDREGIDQHSGFPYRDELLLHYFQEMTEATESERHVVKDPNLWQTLLSLHSPYFDSSLTYFGLFEETKNQWQWKSIELKPALSVEWKYIEGDLDWLFANLKFTHSEKKQAKCFVGMPRSWVAQKNRKPVGYFLSKKISEVRKYVFEDSSMYAVDRSYSIPLNTLKLKSLLMVDQVGRSVNWPVNFSTKNNYSAFDPNLYENKQSSLFAIFNSGDTTLLSQQKQIGVYGDGSLLYYQPYILIPQFADLNSDGLQDIIVETSGETSFFTQKEDGSFEKQK